MGAQGTATVDFGAFPGTTDASVAVIGQTGIVAGSLAEAWIRPEATADHTADEHRVEQIEVLAADIVAGTGFTIYAKNTNTFMEQSPPPRTRANEAPAADRVGYTQGRVNTLYGLWTVGWVWN